MKTQKLKVTLNEVRRMQELAGIPPLNESKIKKFDDVHIKSMNLSGTVFEIKGNDVVVNTLKKGLVKAKIDDLIKIKNIK